MSSLGDFLDAMVRLRAQKLAAAEYQASAQQEGMSALGKGIGGFLGNLGEGMQQNQQTAQNDALTNQLYNRANPPRAQAVNQALQADADTTIRPGQIPYSDQPLNAGGPFTGGVAGLKIQGMLDTQALNQFKADTSRQGMIDRNLTAGERADTARDRLEETIRHHKELEDAKAQAALDKQAITAMGQAGKSYQESVKAAHAHNTGMTAALSQAAGAKTQEQWQKAVTVVTGLYQAGVKTGFKDLPFPEIPPSPDQKAAAAAAVTPAPQVPGWWRPTPGTTLARTGIPGFIPGEAEIAAQQKQSQANAYQYSGPSEYEMAPEPTAPSTNLQDYMPSAGGGGSAPEGFEVTNAQGQTLVKRGGKWVPK